MEFPSFSAAGGGPSGSSSNAGIQTPISNPFNFDNSGWVINQNSAGSTISATGNKDANQTQQTPAGGGSLASLFAGIDPVILIAGTAVVFLLMKK